MCAACIKNMSFMRGHADCMDARVFFVQFVESKERRNDSVISKDNPSVSSCIPQVTFSFYPFSSFYFDTLNISIHALILCLYANTMHIYLHTYCMHKE